MEPPGLNLNPGPTAYLLCDCKQVTSPLRASVASLASEDGDTMLRVDRSSEGSEKWAGPGGWRYVEVEKALSS